MDKCEVLRDCLQNSILCLIEIYKVWGYHDSRL